ncbi:M56 family metallopeptidase [Streptomyces olivaceus]|uniref:M56 family metallopeptidase n=1 Tax=Streptomyces olivaceus TaxID=47716 RepID=UPI0035DE3DAF
MTYVLVVISLTLAFPWPGVAIARRLAGVLPPLWACWMLTSAAVLLAGGTVAALVALFHVPFLASLEHVSLTRVWRTWPTAVVFAGAAGAIMLAQLVLLVRRWAEHRAVLRRAWQSADAGTRDEGVLVVSGTGVDAFALPAYGGREAQIVVTSQMVRALKPDEQAVLLAHERAHLAGRHHLLSAIVDLGSVVHPALRHLRDSLTFHLERWADEKAAATVGDRRVAAAAIARAALARGSDRGAGGYPLLSAVSGPVPRRVEALLLPAPVVPRRTGQRALVLLLAGVVVAAGLSALGLAYGLHEYVEYAARRLIGDPSGCSGMWGTLEHWFGSGAP